VQIVIIMVTKLIVCKFALCLCIIPQVSGHITLINISEVSQVYGSFLTLKACNIVDG